MLTQMWPAAKDSAVVANGDEGVTVRCRMRAHLHLLEPSCRNAIQLAVKDETKGGSLTRVASGARESRDDGEFDKACKIPFDERSGAAQCHIGVATVKTLSHSLSPALNMKS